MKILITGSRGYIGKALCIELLETTQHTVIGVDNDSRADWVERCGGKVQLSDIYYDSLINITGDLTNRDFVHEILAIHKPDAIIHLASQPSMPYSQINSERALFTQHNNMSMCVNLLWGLKELNALDTRFIITTTTGIPGQHYRTIQEQPTLNAAGSWYHVSRGFDSSNCNLASRQWNLNVIEFRTSIVYGLQTKVMKDIELATRFDTDPYFGTVLNRFVKQATDGKELTVYGQGLQTKPFISLNDTVVSLKNAVTHKFKKGHTILNQTTETISIDKLAEIIQRVTSCIVQHIKNPRKESETHKMQFRNKEFLKVLGKEPDKIRDGIKEITDYLATWL